MKELHIECFREGNLALSDFQKTGNRTKFKEWLEKWDRVFPQNFFSEDADKFLDMLENTSGVGRA